MLSKDEAFKLTRFTYDDLSPSAAALRDEKDSKYITYSPKVIIPVTHLCRDACSYCAFVKTPEEIDSPYLNLDEIAKLCISAIEAKSSEALIILGEFPEDKYDIARKCLDENGYDSTIDYVYEVSKYILENFGLLSYTNTGAISAKNITKLKQVSVSQSMMLETTAARLSEPGGPHYDCPDKAPALRLSTLEAAGRSKVPFSTGILVGIGETREETISALLAIRELDQRFNHIQEVVVQNFIPKANTKMAEYPQCDKNEYLWAIAAARLIFQNTTHIQAPPSIDNSVLDLVNAGVDDIGGITPSISIDESRNNFWPHLHNMQSQLKDINKKLVARASIYPEYIDKNGFVDENVLPYIKAKVNSKGLLKNDPARKEYDSREEIDLVSEENKSNNLRSRNFPIKHK